MISVQPNSGSKLTILCNYDVTKYAVSKLTLTKRCSLIFMKFQHCCRYGQLCCSNVERPFDFVTSVYRAKAIRFNNRVEFNFVASVYRALRDVPSLNSDMSIVELCRFL